MNGGGTRCGITLTLCGLVSGLCSALAPYTLDAVCSRGTSPASVNIDANPRPSARQNPSSRIGGPPARLIALSSRAGFLFYFLLHL